MGILDEWFEHCAKEDGSDPIAGRQAADAQMLRTLGCGSAPLTNTYPRECHMRSLSSCQNEPHCSEQNECVLYSSVVAHMRITKLESEQLTQSNIIAELEAEKMNALAIMKVMADTQEIQHKIIVALHAEIASLRGEKFPSSNPFRDFATDRRKVGQ